LAQDRLREACGDFNLTLAPVLYEGGYDYEALAVLAEGDTSLGGAGNLREGLVVRAVSERRSDVVNGRAIAKFIRYEPQPHQFSLLAVSLSHGDRSRCGRLTTSKGVLSFPAG